VPKDGGQPDVRLVSKSTLPPAGILDPDPPERGGRDSLDFGAADLPGIQPRSARFRVPRPLSPVRHQLRSGQVLSLEP
jgi:hypothetical protein